MCHPRPVRHAHAGGYFEHQRSGKALNTDARELGGSGMGNLGGVEADAVRWHDRQASLRLTLPPLAALYFVPDGG